MSKYKANEKQDVDTIDSELETIIRGFSHHIYTNAVFIRAAYRHLQPRDIFSSPDMPMPCTLDTT
jgi:hypothetical protein